MKNLNDIEKLMQEQSSKKGQFAYNNTHWESMSAMLDANDEAMHQIENAFKAQASSTGLEFKSEFWNEMEQMLDGNASTASRVDQTLASDASKQSFLYKEKYWKEMSAILDRHDRKKKLAMWTSIAAACLVAIGIITSLWNTIPEYNKLTVTGQDSDFEYNDLGGDFDIVSKNMDSDGSIESIESGLSGSQERKTNFNKHSFNFNHVEERKEIKVSINGSMEHEGDPKLLGPDSKRNYNDLVEIELRREEIENLMLPEHQNASEFIDLTLKKPSITRSSFYVHAGMLMANAPEGNVSDRATLGIGFKGGLGYSFMKKNWGFETGVNFIYRTGLNHELHYNRKLYGTKLWEETDRVKYKAIISLEVPILAKFQIRNHLIGAGVSGVWNITAHSSYEQYKSYSDDVSVIQNNFGTKDGFKPFDVRMQLQYEYQFNNGLALGMNTHFGIIDQIDRTNFTNSNGYRDIGGALFLKYNFIRL